MTEREKPDEVTVNPQPAPAQPAKTLDQKLADLRALRDRDLINEEEYRARKIKILQEL